MGWLRRLVRDLSGRTDTVFVDLLLVQVHCASDAAAALEAAMAGERDVATAAADVHHAEARADEARNSLITELNQVLTTPLDREDLFRLSRSIDDVADNLLDLADALSAFNIADASGCLPPLAALREGLGAMGRAVSTLSSGALTALPAAAREAKRANAVRGAFLEALAELFQESVTGDVLARRELLRRLDVAGLRLDEAADTLADAALKRA